MGTAWAIEAEGCAPSVLADAEREVHTREERFSRFRASSVLSQLNRERRADNPELAALLCVALELRAGTGGAFDPTLGDALQAAGYDGTFQQVLERDTAVTRPAVGTPAVRLAGDSVLLDGVGSVDLGGIAKGWAADVVARLLRDRGAERFAVDAGGDFVLYDAAGDEQRIELCAGGYVVGIASGAVASSSALHRRWRSDRGDMHHIISAATQLPATGPWVMTSVLAPDATTADALATALLADATLALPHLGRCGAAALLIDGDGRCMMTSTLEQYLR
jgi:thiamine biosynthesis lipoprotein